LKEFKKAQDRAKSAVDINKNHYSYKIYGDALYNNDI
jgi:hypothetical protein